MQERTNGDPTSQWSRCSTRSRRSSSAKTICWSVCWWRCYAHILVEGVPGLAKTMAIKTLADTIGGQFQRIQFTPSTLCPPT